MEVRVGGLVFQDYLLFSVLSHNYFFDQDRAAHVPPRPLRADTDSTYAAVINIVLMNGAPAANKSHPCLLISCHSSICYCSITVGIIYECCKSVGKKGTASAVRELLEGLREKQAFGKCQKNKKKFIIRFLSSSYFM